MFVRVINYFFDYILNSYHFCKNLYTVEITDKKKAIFLSRKLMNKLLFYLMENTRVVIYTYFGCRYKIDWWRSSTN